MKTKTTSLIIIFCAIFFLNACVLPLRFTEVRGSGDLMTISRPLYGVNAVELNSIGKLIVKQGPKESIEITAEENLIKYITSETMGSNLRLGVEENVNLRPTRDIIFRLTLKDLRRISFSGMGEIEVSDLQTDRLAIILSGSGDVTVDNLTANELSTTTSGLGNIDISGSVDNQDVTISGMASYQAENLFCRTAEVSISGSGDAVVWVSEELDAAISGAGNIDYYGDPVVKTDISGVGSINSLGKK